MKSISITELYQKVEEQKNIALSTPVIIFGSDAAISALNPITSSLQDFLNNQNIFTFHSSNRDEIEKTLASSINKTLAFCIYKSDKVYHETYVENSLLPRFDRYPQIDLYCVDLCKAKMAEVNKILEFNIKTYPVILTFRAGHFVDQISINLEKSTNDDPLSAIRAEQMKKFHETPKFHSDGTKVDAEKEAFEERLREKELEKQRKEEEERRRYALEVKKKIEQDKIERRRKFGKL